ncbi:SDR family NAD(P)-dependent oxidoreductase [Desulfatitalea alkaliphila]|uniref:3-oxoacyl-ACP reductase FabG n=1 Tax=Desulfatitalea alkaliphila TaxID=2929485 RepID=A0AA41R4L1_9BACT|nr:3-oxoacyl-ACP reductase family protein [Desulfatitalea alkaliphila]MCJ8500696.1 3-oxoacyl-ACP reductase FabG [Desulfatitalea alkaliphila]
MEEIHLPDMRLNGQVAMVTGASRGIGKWIALGLADAGARVAVVSRSLEGSRATAQEIGERGGSAALPIEADVSDVDAIQRMVQEVVEHFGRIDCLINNAGINVHKPMLEITPADFDAVSGVNFRGVYFTSQVVAKAMIAQGGGRIVNISSSAGVLLRPGIPNSVYAGTKAAVIMLTKAFAEELAQHKINVNAVAPGYFATPMTTDRISDPEIHRTILALTPIKQIGGPADIIGPVLFLASEAARFITGQTIFVDGGRTII